MAGDEQAALADLHGAVVSARERLAEGSEWAPTLDLLADELRDGQPFFFKLDLAASSRSNSETPVASV